MSDPSLQDLLDPSHQEDLRVWARDRKHPLPGVPQGPLREPAGQPAASRQTVPSAAVDLRLLSAAGARSHLSDQGVIEVHVEVGGDLPAVLDVEEGQDRVEGLHL